MKAVAAALCAMLPFASVQAQPAGLPSAGQTKAQYLSGFTIETLLNSGFEIRAASGPLVYLMRPAAGGRPPAGAACTFDLTRGDLADPASVQTARSACFGLN